MMTNKTQPSQKNNHSRLSKEPAQTEFEAKWTEFEVRCMLEGLLTLCFTDLEVVKSPPELYSSSTSNFIAIASSVISTSTGEIQQDTMTLFSWLSQYLYRRVFPFAKSYRARHPSSVHVKLFTLSMEVGKSIGHPHWSTETFEECLKRWNVNVHQGWTRRVEKLMRKDTHMHRVFCTRQRKKPGPLVSQVQKEVTQIDETGDDSSILIEEDDLEIEENYKQKYGKLITAKSNVTSSHDSHLSLSSSHGLKTEDCTKKSPIDIGSISEISCDTLRQIAESIPDSFETRPREHVKVYIERQPPKELLEGLKNYLNIKPESILLPKKKVDEKEGKATSRTFIPNSMKYGGIWYTPPSTWWDILRNPDTHKAARNPLPSALRRNPEVRNKIDQFLLHSMLQGSSNTLQQLEFSNSGVPAVGSGCGVGGKSGSSRPVRKFVLPRWKRSTAVHPESPDVSDTQAMNEGGESRTPNDLWEMNVSDIVKRIVSNTAGGGTLGSPTESHCDSPTGSYTNLDGMQTRGSGLDRGKWEPEEITTE